MLASTIAVVTKNLLFIPFMVQILLSVVRSFQLDEADISVPLCNADVRR